MGDEADRARLERMSEKEREEEIFKRAEKREMEKKRFEIEKKLKLQRKRNKEEVKQAGLAIKNPPKKIPKTHLKKPTKNVFFLFFLFF
jgi:hypothetical protein